jgi:hypothetical protein
VAAAAAGRPQPVRLISPGTVQTELRQAGQRLADRLGRDVLAPDATAVRAPDGALFVPCEAGGGWVRLRPGQPPESDSRRFPAPWWKDLPLPERAAELLAQPAPISPTTIAEPLPGGVWLHAPGRDPRLARLREWLCARLARPDDTLIVVLGYPGSPPLPASDAALFWDLLPAEVRSSVRFTSFRPHRVDPAARPPPARCWPTCWDSRS